MSNKIEVITVSPEDALQVNNSNYSSNGIYGVYGVYGMESNVTAIPVEIVGETVQEYTENERECNSVNVVEPIESRKNGVDSISVLPSQDSGIGYIKGKQ